MILLVSGVVLCILGVALSILGVALSILGVARKVSEKDEALRTVYLVILLVSGHLGSDTPRRISSVRSSSLRN